MILETTPQARHRMIKNFYAWGGLLHSRLRVSGWAMLEGEPVKPHHFIVTEEEEGYLVSALKAPNQNKDSYVEVLLRPDHPMYERIQGAVSMLNIAGVQTEVEGVGESFQTGVYHVIVNDAEHAELIGSVK